MKSNKAKKTKFSAKKEIPDFELADIMGEFEIDDLGNFIIVRGADNELLDKRERRVNRRGYLVDRFGNVVNTQGNVIFKAIELDVDDEIPAPFGFEKRKKNLMKLAEENTFKIETPLDIADNQHEGSQHVGDDEDLIEREIVEVRDVSEDRSDEQQAVGD